MFSRGRAHLGGRKKYAAPRNSYSHIPQYDDNGNGISQEAPVPAETVSFSVAKIRRVEILI
jgi:hypothetical protein